MAFVNLSSTPSISRCYFCGALEDLTHKNVPSASFFPDELRNDLLVVVCCEKCRTEAGQEDGAMRLWLSSSEGASEEGQMIYSQYALPHLHESSENFKALANYHPGDFLVNSHHGLLTPSRGFLIPQHRAGPFIKRLTMAMLTIFYPEYKYFDDTFLSAYREVKTGAIDDLREHMEVLSAFSIHPGIFRMWHGLSDSGEHPGMWIYVFYNCVAFVCIHGPAGQLQAAFPAGHEGWKNLF